MSWLSWKWGLDKNKDLLKSINAAIAVAANPEVRKFQKKLTTAWTAKGFSAEDADTAWYVLMDVLGA